ncbi:MAG: SDR family oxidoreductase [Methanolinea sp.]
MLKKRIVIIGASGFIGNTLYHSLHSHLTGSYQIDGTYYSTDSKNNLKQLDITCFKKLEHFVLKESPSFILLTAGNKNVQDCQNDFSRAISLNTRPVEDLIKIITCYQLPVHLLFFSTDYVFNGRTGLYKDTDIPNPSTNYGKTKYMAEQALQNSNISYKIIRTAAVVGKGGNFFNWIINKIIHEKTMKMYDNVFFSPTSSIFLTEMISRIIKDYEQIPQKTIHIVGEERFNRYQFAILLKKLLKSDVQIQPEQNFENSTLFQPDLSLTPSDLINRWRRRTFEDYLKDEILHAEIYK